MQLSVIWVGHLAAAYVTCTPLCSQPVGYILEDSNILLRQVNPLLKLLDPIIYGPFICLHVLSTRLVMVGYGVRVFWMFAGHAHKETLCGIYPRWTQ